MAELGVFIGVLGGVATSLILTFQKSKCTRLSCCGCEIEREIKQIKQTDPLGAKVPFTPSPEPEPEPELSS
tara:strand:+ start:933 stop:1145 length:213 start_codon:yes stop_codon:yes gene_type:complete